ncbi:site-specific integrase [Halorarum salinum]|uniref:Site-specific integrase n=1 Tax=Halorarum salinum TaxID=2743089 RepID=A0A7D5QB60_9EURY|nr:site-specific integrase [Halobaculum salinum]
MLEAAAPARARFYYLLYAGGFRIGELKRHGRKHLRPDYGTYGAINILRTQHLPGQGENRSSKSKQSRTVEFLSKYPTLILEDTPVGTWMDENDVEWTEVFFPEYYAQLENHYLRKYCNKIGVHRVTPHSFRHMRITHLVHSDDHEKDWVQRRSGHADGKTTDHYTQTVFDREPQPLETYLEENDIDLMDVLAAH